MSKFVRCLDDLLERIDLLDKHRAGHFDDKPEKVRRFYLEGYVDILVDYERFGTKYTIIGKDEHRIAYDNATGEVVMEYVIEKGHKEKGL